MNKYTALFLGWIAVVAEWAAQLFLQAAIFSVVAPYFSSPTPSSVTPDAIFLNFKIVLIFYLFSLYAFTSLALQFDVRKRSLWVNLFIRTLLFLVHESFVLIIDGSAWVEKLKIALESLPIVVLCILVCRLIFAPAHRYLKR